MKILALDIGTKTGWAHLRDGQITSGVEEHRKKPYDSPGVRWLAFKKFLHIKTAVGHQPWLADLIAFEIPAQRGGSATKILMGYVAHVEAFCTTYGLQHAGVRISELKRLATGSGNANKMQMLEAAIMKWPQQFPTTYVEGLQARIADGPKAWSFPGDTDPNYDRADALWILEWAKGEFIR